MCEGSSFSTSSPTIVIIFFVIAILVGVKCYLTVILICISLMNNDVEHHVLIGHLYIFFREISIQILCPLVFGLFVFLLLTYKASFYNLYTSRLSDIWLVNIFTHSVGCLFIWCCFLKHSPFQLDFVTLQECLNIAVPNLFGTRDWFRERQFFQGQGSGGLFRR